MKNREKKKPNSFRQRALTESQLHPTNATRSGEDSFHFRLTRPEHRLPFPYVHAWGSHTSAFPVSAIQDIGDRYTGWNPEAQCYFLNSGQTRPRIPFSGHFLLSFNLHPGGNKPTREKKVLSFNIFMTGRETREHVILLFKRPLLPTFPFQELEQSQNLSHVKGLRVFLKG